MKNFRDFAYDGLKTGLLYRGPQLVELSREDKELLFGKCGIATVIDLRAPEEVEENPDADIPGVENINLPLLTIPEMSEMVESRYPNVPHSYALAVRPEKKGIWTRVFDVLLEKEGGILLHCSQGKDRTGIVAAVILSALGLSKETVFKDYLLTNESLSMPDEYRQYADTLPPETKKLFMGLFFADQDFLLGAFDEIEKVYGGFDNFLLEACGLTEDKKARLLSKYKGVRA